MARYSAEFSKVKVEHGYWKAVKGNKSCAHWHRSKDTAQECVDKHGKGWKAEKQAYSGV